MSEIDSNLTAVEIREVYQNQQDRLIKHEARKVLVSHLGTFSQDLVSSISESTEEIVKSAGDDRLVVKRIFSILIEGLQNIRLHGEKDELDRQLGYLIVSRDPTEYKITMANMINFEDYQKVEKYLEGINDLSETHLRETYIDILSNEFLSNKGGAGLGFITTRMKSGNPLVYSFFNLKDEKMLFTFEVRVTRK
ncbi:MAG: SiaB family protein kinase [Crocinitomicaceae bacterium]|nr:SiaB family protein kinase [Crocinitomicaceae bacterium]